MPGEGELYKVIVGEQFIGYLPPGGDALAIEAPDGTRTVVINGAGEITDFTPAGAVTVPGAFVAEDAATFEAAVEFEADVTLTDVDIVLGTTTGTQIGTADTQKLGFYGATPIVKPTLATSDAAGIITALENLGLVNDAGE